MLNITLLKTDGGAVRVFNDFATDTYSIGIRTREGIAYKYISKELYVLLIKELSDKVSIRGLINV